MSKPELPPLVWSGFNIPSYTQVPDLLFDILLPYLSDPELRVLLYIIRRTFGFKKDRDNISLQQITEGIVRRDGERLDYGCGVGKTAAIKAVKGLVEKNIIAKQNNRSDERGDEATTYTLVFNAPVFAARTPPVHGANTGQYVPQTPPVHGANTQETVVQQTVEQEDIDADAKNENEPPLYSPWVAAVITDFSREFNDLANSAANVDRALRLCRSSGLSEEEFVMALQQAKATTRKAQGSRGGVANKMARLLQEVAKLAQPGGNGNG